MKKTVLMIIASLCLISCKKMEWNLKRDNPLDGVTNIEEPVADDSTLTQPKVEIDMVYVQGGTFNMGSNDGNNEEKPVHQVRLSNFYIGKYEITQAQWKAIMGSNPSKFKGDNLPVENVSWNDVQEFIFKLNVQTGQNYRLPTEAEWEYAARGGIQSNGYSYSGSNSVEEVAWYYSNSDNKTHAVGTKKANELGIYDMSGNVWEWCADWYGSYSSSTQTNPAGSASGFYRIDRGGSWSSNASYCRVAFRDFTPPSDSLIDMGFRIVRNSSNNSSDTSINSILREMVLVEGGVFSMGSNNGGSNEKPVHQVMLSDFYIGKYEITQAQWKAVMGSNPSKFKGDNLPVENVSWSDVQEFILKLNAQTGQDYRLPTEAEWEYAARGGLQSNEYGYSGSNNVNDVAWYYSNSDNKTHVVGTKKANELGLYDMSGNVWEWCADWYGSYNGNTQMDPTGPASGSYRIDRGGSWSSNASYCRTTFRDFTPPDDSVIDIGFRLARNSK